MRLVICDGNRILGEALAAALECCGHGLNAVAVTAADECVAAVGSYAPDICVLDAHLSGTAEGLHAVREIRGRFPGTAVVVAGDASGPGIVPKAGKLGIAGFLAKSRGVSEMADALRKIACGQPVFDPVPHTASHRDPSIALAPREAEVLRRIAAGQSTRQMACEMNIAISTLRTYIKNIFAKIGVRTRLETMVERRGALLVPGVPPPSLPQKTHLGLSGAARPENVELP